MNETAEEMVQALRTVKEYTEWEYTCLSVCVLMNVAAVTPQLRSAVKHILGILMDGQVELRQAHTNGILSLAGKQEDSRPN